MIRIRFIILLALSLYLAGCKDGLSSKNPQPPIDTPEGMIEYLEARQLPPLQSVEIWQNRLAPGLKLTTAHYRLADVFVCMSEHEGFGKPLIESMYFDVPVIAYAAAAVPHTLGDAGILVYQKDYPLIAELIDLLLTDRSLLEKLLAGQRNRFEAFRQAAMLESLCSYLDEVL